MSLPIQFANKSVVSVIGCGGKTSLINLLAKSYKNKKVLITTTTKIFPTQSESVKNIYSLKDFEDYEPENGITCAGELDNQSGKLGSFPLDKLEASIKKYDYIFIEADGSKALPCKGWAEYEPVIPDFTTDTIGVVTLSAIGKPVSDKTVHRISEFTKLTGAQEGEIISLDILERMLFAGGGMFSKPVGKRHLVINKIENEEEKHIVKGWLPKLKGKGLDNIFYGSILRDIWQEG